MFRSIARLRTWQFYQKKLLDKISYINGFVNAVSYAVRIRQPISISSTHYRIHTLLKQKLINMSAIRQNFHESCEAAINKQINMELHASYVYMSMVRNLPFYAVSFNFLTLLNTLYNVHVIEIHDYLCMHSSTCCVTNN